MTREELLKLNEIIKASASFNIYDITNVLAELVSKVEGEKYIPIIYGNNNWKTLKYFAAVAEEYLADEFVAYSKYTSEDFGTYAFNLLKDNSFIDIYHSSKYQDDNYNKQVTFCRLLNKYGIECNSNIINNNDFSQFSYINDFIRYLFELQLANGGTHLTYEEMQVALNDFLELEKDNSKTKIKSLKAKENN